MPRRFYLAAAVIGAIVPWVFFASFFAGEGFNLQLFLESLFANPAAAGFVADLLISAVVFLVWSYYDARKLGVRRWWVILLAGLAVGLSLALPLYLYMREDGSGISSMPETAG